MTAKEKAIPFAMLFREEVSPGDVVQILGSYNVETQTWDWLTESGDPATTICSPLGEPPPLPPPTMCTLLTRAKPFPVPDLEQDD